MSLQLTITIDGETFNPLSFNINYFREFSDLTGISTSPIKSGLIAFTLFLGDESTDKHVFADAFADPSKKLNMTIDTKLAVSSSQQIMSYSVQNAQCVQYAVNYTLSTDPNSLENGFVTVSVVAPQISVGQANFIVGE